MRISSLQWIWPIALVVVGACGDSPLDPGTPRLPPESCCPTWLGDSVIVFEDPGLLDGAPAIESVTLAGTSQVVLAARVRASFPRVSPDGSELLFVGGGQIYRGSIQRGVVDENSLVRLTSDGMNFFPAWSPDGERISYDNIECVDEDGIPRDSLCGVMLMNRDGTGKVWITKGRMPSWLPDGKSLLYQGPGSEVFRVDTTDPQNVVRVSNFGASLDGFGWASVPVYGPAHDLIAVEVREAPGKLAIWLIGPDGENPQRLIGGRAPSWSPSGELLAFTRFGDEDPARDDTVWIVEMSSHATRQVTFR